MTTRDVPAEVVTARLLLRPPRAGDGAMINAAIKESFAELNAWMPWAKELPSVADCEAWSVESARQFADREELPMLMLENASGALLGATGLHRIDWDVPSFEVGYWCRTSSVGHGFVTEAVYALARTAFETLGANRFEARMDDRNVRSYRVAERLGMQLEGVLRRDSRATDGTLRDTRVYSVLGIDELKRPS